jgi:ferredoxin--NADP+ reductase
LHLRFLLRPTAICGDAHVTGMQFERGHPDGAGGAAGAGQSVHLPTDMVLRSVGYRGVPIPGLPFDDKRGVIPNAAGRILRDGAPVPGEYVAGWIKRGPSGVIGTNKHDATETVHCLLQDAPALPRDRSATQTGSSTCCISAAYESSRGRAGRRLKPSRSRPGDDAAPSRSRSPSASYS